MSTLLGLLGVCVACGVALWVFSPRYGAGRGCTGCALETVMNEEKLRLLEQSSENGPEAS